jgi:hypothetical protein
MRSVRNLVLVVLLAQLLAVVPLGSAHAALLPGQNDAGSGGDAPDVRTAAVPIQAGPVYSGAVDGGFAGIATGATADVTDWYSVSAPAATTLHARVWSLGQGCVALYDPAGTELDRACGLTPALDADIESVTLAAGTYYLRLDSAHPEAYRFSVGAGGRAPDPAPVPLPPPPPLPTPLERPGPGPFPSVTTPAAAGAHTVVAVVGTGINPYHDFFDAPALTAHPSTWLPGFPSAATPVSLSLGAADYDSAVAADAATWAGLQRSSYDLTTGTYDEHVYTFPGTRVVAGVSIGAPFTSSDATPLLDDEGEGTYHAGLAAGAGLGAADGDVLIVAVEASSWRPDAVRWAARQPWIDAIVVPDNLAANATLTTTPAGERKGMEWATYEAHRRGKPVFAPAGGVTLREPAEKCTTYTSENTGPAWVTRVGATPEDAYGTYHCVPVDAVTSPDVLSPARDSVDATDLGPTLASTAAPASSVAGQYAALLLDARRAGSTASRTAVLDHLLHAATPVESPAPLAEQGYGVVDDTTRDAASTALAAGAGPRPRPETTEWFARDRAVRESLWGPTGVTAGPDARVALGHDDAGSGRDAPDARSDALPVVAGPTYDGMLTGGGDTVDLYAIDAAAGDELRVAFAAATYSCVLLFDPAGTPYGGRECVAAYQVDWESWTPNDGDDVLVTTLPASGTWYLRVTGDAYPAPYSFRLALGT